MLSVAVAMPRSCMEEKAAAVEKALARSTRKVSDGRARSIVVLQLEYKQIYLPIMSADIATDRANSIIRYNICR